MAEVREMVERAQAAWAAGDVDAWLGLFLPDAKFFIPGSTPVSGDHDAESFRKVADRLMHAGGDDSGQWVIDTYTSDNGGIALVDQKVLRDGKTHHYHAMFLYELGPNSRDQFAYWWTMVHEYDGFERAWG